MIKFEVLGDPERIVPVKGYEGLYVVSDQGYIRSLERNGTKGIVLGGCTSGGYRRVYLYKNNKRKRVLVHRIVAETFLDKVPGKKYVNHIDGDKLNNAAENLEWCTTSENVKHAIKLGLLKANVGPAHKVRHENTKRKIDQLTEDGQFIKTFDSIQEAAAAIGLKDGTHISAVAKGKRRKCGGYVWRYHSL